jgi:hypothetical protein
MTTKVVVYNEGPKNVVVDNGQEIKIVHPGAKESQYVYKGKAIAVFEVDETTISES